MAEEKKTAAKPAATKTTAKKNVRVNGLYKGKYNYCYYQHGRKVRNAWKTSYGMVPVRRLCFFCQ